VNDYANPKHLSLPELSRLAELAVSEDNPYWLGPFQNYRTFCPYLVGSHERVAAELARYMRLGFGTFILDVPGPETKSSSVV
jgi:alkanesulfonate monooxygenase